MNAFHCSINETSLTTPFSLSYFSGLNVTDITKSFQLIHPLFLYFSVKYGKIIFNFILLIERGGGTGPMKPSNLQTFV